MFVCAVIYIGFTTCLNQFAIQQTGSLRSGKKTSPCQRHLTSVNVSVIYVAWELKKQVGDHGEISECWNVVTSLAHGIIARDTPHNVVEELTLQ